MLTLCHIPYAFKVRSLPKKRLSSRGYTQILWLDTSVNPLTDLEYVFSIIERRGHLLTYVGPLSQNAPAIIPEAASALDLTKDLYKRIYHLSSSIIGLNMESPAAVKLLAIWLEETKKVYPNITWFPEELSLSTAAHRAHCAPYCRFRDLSCWDNELPTIKGRPSLQFFLHHSILEDGSEPKVDEAVASGYLALMR